MLVFFSVNEAFAVYSDSPTSAVLYALMFGFLWGWGSVCFGLGADAVGNSLGFSLILVSGGSRLRPLLPCQ